MLCAMCVTVLAAATGIAASQAQTAEQKIPLAGAGAYGDWRTAAPGVVRHIHPSDLPAPYETRSAANGPDVVRRPDGARLALPPGFSVSPLATGLDEPRQMRRAPNGDIFLAESGGRRILVLRAGAVPAIFAAGLAGRPYGIAFYPPGPAPRFVYVATEGKVLRFPYRVGDTKAAGPAETIVPDVPVGYHWTRDIVFTPDGRRLLLAVGSGSNDGEDGMAHEARRADILEYDPGGRFIGIFASGLRNPVTLAFYPGSGDLWATVNERDGLGDDLPPDYVTRVVPGGFYGWPWFYIGGHQDPRHRGADDSRRASVRVPDVLLQPHSAPLGMAVYTGRQFPPSYRGDIFVALHGSWNRARRTGYKIVRVLLRDGRPTGAYEDFMTGFVAADGAVWGRPVGVVVTADGALLVSDDGSGTVWRITYDGTGAKPR
jgi:glucose/arabinose dehydrogenase